MQCNLEILWGLVSRVSRTGDEQVKGDTWLTVSYFPGTLLE